VLEAKRKTENALNEKYFHLQGVSVSQQSIKKQAERFFNPENGSSTFF
jgi:hypothetical protein